MRRGKPVPSAGSIRGGRRRGAYAVTTAEEGIAQAFFTLCAFTAVFAVAFISLYMIAGGLPALSEVGPKEILLGAVWEPVAEEPAFGILYVMAASAAGTALALLPGALIGILTAVFLAEYDGNAGGCAFVGRLAGVVRQAVELLACIPSVLYGLLGVYLLNPLIYRLELRLFAGSKNHQFTGGSNLLSAAVVLSVMILPTVISAGEAAIRAVGPDIRAASLALGASRMQTAFRAVLPAARRGLAAAVALGAGRAMGEAMAVSLVSGNSVRPPLPFHSVRFLAAAIVNEMGYSQGLHRQMLFTIGLVLFLFILLVNIVLERISGK